MLDVLSAPTRYASALSISVLAVSVTGCATWGNPHTGGLEFSVDYDPHLSATIIARFVNSGKSPLTVFLGASALRFSLVASDPDSVRYWAKSSLRSAKSPWLRHYPRMDGYGDFMLLMPGDVVERSCQLPQEYASWDGKREDWYVAKLDPFESRVGELYVEYIVPGEFIDPDGSKLRAPCWTGSVKARLGEERFGKPVWELLFLWMEPEPAESDGGDP